MSTTPSGPAEPTGAETEPLSSRPTPAQPVESPRDRRPGNRREPGAGGQASEPTGHKEPIDEILPELEEPVKKSGISGAAWAALILALVVLVLLLIFVIQNSTRTQFDYMAWTFDLPLGVAMLLAAIGGALLTFLVGSWRILVLSRRVKKLEKQRRQIAQTLKR